MKSTKKVWHLYAEVKSTPSARFPKFNLLVIQVTRIERTGVKALLILLRACIENSASQTTDTDKSLPPLSNFIIQSWGKFASDTHTERWEARNVGTKARA